MIGRVSKHHAAFNRDDLVERAYRDRYDENMPKITSDGTTAERALWECTATWPIQQPGANDPPDSISDDALAAMRKIRWGLETTT